MAHEDSILLLSRKILFFLERFLFIFFKVSAANITNYNLMYFAFGKERDMKLAITQSGRIKDGN